LEEWGESAGCKAGAEAGLKGFMAVQELKFRERVCDAHGFEQPRVNIGKTSRKSFISMRRLTQA
jgi:hypothetical protein